MDFRVLGLLEVGKGGEALSIARGRESALLALLLLNPNAPVSTDRVLDELWEGQLPENAAKTVQIYISRLRQRLGRERIVTTPAGYLLLVEPLELDAARFERLASEGRNELEAGNAARADAVLSEALDLWRGPAFADFRYNGFARSESGRLDELRRSAVADRIEARLALGGGEELIAELEALVLDQRLWERPRRQLMLALYRSGRQADALDLYRSTRALLAAELGLDPGPELQALESAILNQDPDLLPPPRATPRPRPVEPWGEEDGSRGAFVGRNDELGALVAGLGDAFEGHGRLFLLVGEPGIGKSRLAEELLRIGRSRGARVLVGRAWEAGGAPVFWPWVQSLRSAIREIEPDVLRAQLGAGAAELAQILPELREQFPDLPSLLPAEPETARFRLFDATSSFLRTLSGLRPTVLFLDDLHAADEPSLLLLRFLTRELGTMRMLVLVAFRDVDPLPSRPLRTLQTEVAREPVTRALHLQGLSEQDVAELVELTASQIGSPEFVTALHEETEGNPLFVSESVRLLTLEGLQQGAAGRMTMPQSVSEVIRRRLGHLSEDCGRLLTLASILGREFSLDALILLAELPEKRVLEAIDEATASRVLTDVSGSADLRFAHVLLRDTLYDDLGSARRVRLHGQALATLERLYANSPGPHLAELAHHATAGRQFGKAIDYARRAGDHALELLAYEEAARLYQMALKALARLTDRDEGSRCRLLLSLGEAEARSGNSPKAREAFLAAADVARPLGLAPELARAATGYGGRIVWVRAGADERLVPLLEEALAGLGDEQLGLRVRLLARLAGALRDEPDRSRRDALSLEAVTLARRCDDPAVLAYALVGRGHAILAPDTLDECGRLGAELLDLAAQIGDREQVVAARMLRSLAHLMVGDAAGAEADAAAATGVAKELRQPVQLWLVTSLDAMFALMKGRLAEAEELIEHAYQLGEHALPEGAVSHVLVQRYTLGDFRGGLEAMQGPIRQLAADNPARPAFRCVLAHLLARIGRLEEAQRELDELVGENGAALPFDQEWLYSMSLLAETSTLTGDTASAAILYRALAPWEAFNAVDVAEGVRGSIARYLGDLAATLDRRDDAVRHYEAALAGNERMGARPWLAQTQQAYGNLLLAHGNSVEHRRGRLLLDEALAAYDQLGMTAYHATAAGS